MTLARGITELYQAKVSENAEKGIEIDFDEFSKQIEDGIRENTLDLSKLRFGTTVLSRIPRFFRQLSSVTRINFYGNLIREGGMAKISQILQWNPAVVDLNIGSNDITDGALGILCDIIETSNLLSLQLGSFDTIYEANRFSRIALPSILASISARNRLKAVGIAGLGAVKQRKSQRYREFAHHLSVFITKCTELEILDISSCALVDVDQSVLANGFALNANLRRLDLHGNSFPTGTSIIEGIVQLQKLVFLNVSNCELGEGACNVITETLSNGWSLISLNISRNRFSSESIARLLDVLSGNLFLTNLNIADTGFDPSIEPHLSRFLRKNEIIAYLNLSNNNLGSAIRYGLDETNLMGLNLSTCRLMDIDAISVCRAISRNRTLKSLYMRNNFLTKPVGYQLIEILRPNESLVKIDVTLSQIDCFAHEGLQLICDRNISGENREIVEQMRKEYVHLSIQGSKTPVVRSRLAKREHEHLALDDDIYELDAKIETTETQTGAAIVSTDKAIVEFRSMIATEEKQIEDMKLKIKDIQEQSVESLKAISRRVEVETREIEASEAEACKLDAYTTEYIQASDAEEKKLREEIALMEEMLEDVMKNARNRKKLAEYEIPEYPYAEEEARLAKEKEDELQRQREEAMARDNLMFGGSVPTDTVSIPPSGTESQRQLKGKKR